MGIKDLLDEIDRAIREGEVGAAQRLLRGANEKTVPRAELARFATLCRRAGLIDVAIRALNPLVRPSPRRPKKASDGERAEYAANLIRIGAADEALALLEPIDPRDRPEVWMHRVSVLFSQWNYRDAIPLLERYIASPKLDEYTKLVGKLNLAAALAYERRFVELEPLRAELDETTQRRKLWRIRGNVLEIAAQSAILRREWKESERLLDEAGHLLERTKAIDLLFVRKWQAVAAILRSPGDAEAVRLLRDVRATASEQARWETVRSCDQYEAIGTHEQSLFRHVYFGTPFESFRALFASDFGWRAPLDSHYDWKPERQSAGTASVIDFRPREAELARSQLKPGQLRHRLLCALANDFYREFPLAGLHAALWPGSFYNPVSSPNRVQQAVCRARSWLETRRIPLGIVERAGFYRLLATGPVTLRLPARAVYARRTEHATQALHDANLKDGFTARDVERTLKLPRWSALRILREALQEGRAAKIGNGPRTRYRLNR